MNIKKTKQEAKSQAKKIAAYSFMPVVGGVLKQPAINIQNKLAVTGDKSIFNTIGALYKEGGAPRFFKGYFKHVAKILPANQAANNALSEARNFADNQLLHGLAAGTAESIFSFTQESLEMDIARSHNTQLRLDSPSSFLGDLLKQTSKASRMLPATTIRNVFCWEATLAVSEASKNIEDATSRFAFEAGSAVTAGVISSPLHMAVGQAYAHQEFSPVKRMLDIAKTNGAKALFASAVPRATMVGVTSFLNVQVDKFIRTTQQNQTMGKG